MLRSTIELIQSAFLFLYSQELITNFLTGSQTDYLKTEVQKVVFDFWD
jgi:hypothetical protein